MKTFFLALSLGLLVGCGTSAEESPQLSKPPVNEKELCVQFENYRECYGVFKEPKSGICFVTRAMYGIAVVDCEKVGLK